ncbi:hypothetical protein BGZ74_002932 [Mortierella antarctica]|nr:hypothetical protein BGZ74_002932 [Mortierella antarctica]
MSELDPFEARVNFLGLLSKLNASQHSIQKVASFAMRYRSMHEDLYNCIIEALDQTPSVNARMNIFYVFDSICQQSGKTGFTGYMDLIGKNLSSIVESVAPSGPKGNVNVAGTKKILELWRSKKLFHHSVIDVVEKPLLARELGARSMTSEAGMAKEDILRRMDEDRERHKRIREEIWIRPADEDPSAEFQQDWDEVSDIDEHDYEDIECENNKYLPGFPWDMEFEPSISALSVPPTTTQSKDVSGMASVHTIDPSPASKFSSGPSQYYGSTGALHHHTTSAQTTTNSSNGTNTNLNSSSAYTSHSPHSSRVMQSRPSSRPPSPPYYGSSGSSFMPRPSSPHYSSSQYHQSSSSSSSSSLPAYVHGAP